MFSFLVAVQKLIRFQTSFSAMLLNTRRAKTAKNSFATYQNSSEVVRLDDGASVNQLKPKARKKNSGKCVMHRLLREHAAFEPDAVESNKTVC